MINHRRALAAVFAAAALTITGCTNSEEASDKANDASTSATTGASEASSEATASEMTLEGAYCKAKGKGNPDAATPKEKQMMTGCFGTLKNGTDKEMTLKDFSVEGLPEGAVLELHETIDGTMTHKPEGFTIPAGESHEMKPGGDHMMLMKIKDEIPAGDSLKFTLKFADGTEHQVDIPVREQASGEENYGEDGSLQQDTGMDEHAGHNH
ncbi:copper chaperone PCu(A)C [Corynebacterium ulceribovis]|uniref:copper chaperone PCu(A)C n=1 Tax=Corynebacterium ulceribovis TaxID=487732 RepID=UPI000382E0F9|nr:copper chaperone PCu(A)C [Corynebacterium ulceribovis]